MNTHKQDWRGRDVAVMGTPTVGMVLGPVESGIATVFVRSTGLAYRVGVEALRLIDRPSRCPSA